MATGYIVWVPVFVSTLPDGTVGGLTTPEFSTVQRALDNGLRVEATGKFTPSESDVKNIQEWSGRRVWVTK